MLCKEKEKEKGEEYEIGYPFVKCYNTTLGTHQIIETHLVVYGILRNFTFWYHYGELFCELLL